MGFVKTIDICTVAHNCHGKSKSLTAKANSLTAKANLLTAQANRWRQKQIHSQQKQIYSRHKQIADDKSKFTHGKSKSWIRSLLTFIITTTQTRRSLKKKPFSWLYFPRTDSTCKSKFKIALKKTHHLMMFWYERKRMARKRFDLKSNHPSTKSRPTWLLKGFRAGSPRAVLDWNALNFLQ